MELIEQTGKLTQADRRAQRMWNAAPWLALMSITLVPPVILSNIALLFGGAPLWLLAIASLPVSFLIAVVVAVTLLFFRRNWVNTVRERLASDGITADEVDWFRSELTKNEKRALKSMEEQQPLLADAYRETIALRLNATRLASRSEEHTSELQSRLHLVCRLLLAK